jgi:hypothetical protein
MPPPKQAPFHHMEVSLNTAVKPLRGRIALGAALLALLAGGLALPHAAHAAFTDNTVCKGTIAAGEKSVDFDNPLKYTIACSNYITSYSISFPGREIDSIETEVFGTDPATNAVIGTDAFSCNGDLPGWGINCVGTYGGSFHNLSANVNLASGNVCSLVPFAPVLTVSYATYTQNADGSPVLSSSGKPTVTTNTAGPFSLKVDASCPKPKKAKKARSKKH